MKLSLVERGGWSAPLAISRPRTPHVIESEKLEPAAAQEAVRLVVAAKAAKPQRLEMAPGPAPEAMTYTITIEDNGETVELRQSDISMSPEFAALLDWIHAQSSAR